MKLFTAIFLCVFCLNAYAQIEDESEAISTDITQDSAQFQTYSKDITLYTSNFKQTVEAINAFIKNNRSSVKSSDKSETMCSIQFIISMSQINALDSMIERLGYVTQNAFKTQSLVAEISNAKRNVKRAEAILKQYESDLELTTLSEEQRQKIRNQIRDQNEQIRNAKYKLEDVMAKVNYAGICQVKLTIRDEVSTPSGSKISFVNMPGFEFNMLFVENPKTGVSAEMYQGYNIKYMFTRGKSYFNLGVYKALNNNTADTSLNSDLFMMQFGQDFYPRNFGRGKRKFLNLYTGYQIGGFVATDNLDKSSGFIPSASVSMGLELFKSKHVLIDNKVNYFLPLNELNRNLRGLNYGFSFNFVF